MNELEQFLETPSAEAVTDTTEAPASATATTEAKTEEGKGKSDAGMPTAVKDESTANDVPKGHIPISAYLDEKRKRQELEAKLQEKEQPKPQEKDEPDMFVDPKAYTEGIKNEIKQTVLSERINLSRELMLETKADYAEKEARFAATVKAEQEAGNGFSPLLAKMHASANPAKFAYETAAKAMADEAKAKLLDEIGDPAAYKEKLKAEILAEIGQSTPTEKPAKPLVEKAPSLATASAAATNTSVTIPSLEEMFDR